jgi:hypothetical protein
MHEQILIGTLSARTGRSVHTIRWYEAVSCNRARRR